MTKRVIVLDPHPDDETLSKWPMMHYLACGYDVHVVHLTRGEVTPASLRFDPDPAHYSPTGQPNCGWPDHPYKHDPVREGFVLPTTEEIGLARLAEAASAVGAMAAIAPVSGFTTGQVYSYDENLGSQYGCDFCGSSTAPVTEAAITKCDEIIRRYMDLLPGSLVWSMSPTDAHPDHRAAGIALRRLKGTPVYNATTKTFTFVNGDPVLAPLLVNASFWVSKRYWSLPADQYGNRLSEYCAWYPNQYPNNTLQPARITEYTAWLKAQVLKAYTAWNPAGGSFAIGGGHSTPSQFADCFGPPPPFVASALWHP
jgi:LmbE family N-acetylglucosaminyl deacetylase